MIGGPERGQDGLHQRAGHIIRPTVYGRLGLLIGELGGGSHQAAHELVACLLALAVEHHPHGHAGARLTLAQAAQSVGQAFGQHRFDPVGEVDAVGLLPRLPVQGRARPHIGGDVGNGDPDHPAAGVLGVLVRMGVDRVVVVAVVLGVNGDQRQVAQIGAGGEGGGLGRLGLGLRRRGKAHGNAVGMDGDQRGGAGLVLAADHLQHLAALGAVVTVGDAHLGQHKIAVLQVAGVSLENDQAFLGATVDGLDHGLAPGLADDAEDLMGALAKAFDDLGL